MVVSFGVIFGVVRDLGRTQTAPARTDAMDEEAQVTFRLLIAVLATSPITLVLVSAFFCFGSLLRLRGSAKAVIGLIPEATVFGRLHQPST